MENRIYDERNGLWYAKHTWDGRNKQGRRVATGIYMVLAADSEGKEGIVTKIAFIK